MSAIETVKIKANEKRQKLESSTSADPLDIKIIDIIEDLICDPGCFLKLDLKLGYEVLSIVGFTQEEILEIYPKLVRKAWIGEYTIVDPPGIIVKFDDWYGEE